MVRAGFTVSELIVVIAVIGVLISLIGPAVQAAREKARQATCSVNLREIGSALHGYEATYQRLPRGGRMPYIFINPDDPSAGAIARSHSPHLYLTPFLEQSVVYELADLNAGTFPGFTQIYGLPDPNERVWNTRLAVFLCPSDPQTSVARNSYRVNLGGAAFPEPPRNYAGKFSGPFTPVDKVPRLSDCTDGLSNTVAFSERVAGDQNPSAYDPRRDIFDVSDIIDPNRIRFSSNPDDDYVSACRRLTNPFPSHYSTAGLYWTPAGLLDTWYNHLLTPNSRIPDCGSTLNVGGAVVTARSVHPNGVNVLLMDGSVRFVTDSISAPVWLAVGGAQDGEIVQW